MAAIAYDTFTDTNGTLITAHTPDIGGTWTLHGSSFAGSTPTIQSNRFQSGTSLYSNWYINTEPSSADYYVSAVIYNWTGIGDNGQGIAIRQSSNASLTGYMLRITGNGILLERHVSGTSTTIGSGAFTFSNIIPWYVRLEAVGTNIKAYIRNMTSGQWLTSDGYVTARTPYYNLTDSGVTEAGFGAIVNWSSNVQVDDYSSETITVPDVFPNRVTNRFLPQRIRKTIYKLKRLFGGPIQLYEQGTKTSDLRTGVITWTGREVIDIKRAIILPVKISREQEQTISMISSDKAFVYGGTYDRGARWFYIDPADLAANYEIKMDQWIVYQGKKYEIKEIKFNEFDGLWEVMGAEMVGVIPEQIYNLSGYSIVDFEQSAEGEV